MSRLAGCCQFCELTLNECVTQCEEKVREELDKINDSQDIHVLIRASTNDKGGDNWKYDKCDFCKEHSFPMKRLTIDDVSYDFCSSKCLLAVMGRIHKLAIQK